MNRNLAIGIFGVSALVLACRGGTDNHSNSQKERPADARTEGAQGEEAAAQSAVSLRTGRLGQGSITVFGLVLPPGTLPKEGAGGIYRFIATFPLAQVYKDISVQISAEKETQEGTGYLLHGVQVRRPRGGGSRDAKLAIRIRRNGSRVGSTLLEIWSEGALASSKKSGQPIASPQNLPRAVVVPKAEAKRREASRREAFAVMQKVQRKEPLTEADRNSEYFH